MTIINSVNNEWLKSGNTKEFVILHHTWASENVSDQQIKKFLNKTDYISAHYLVWKTWVIYQLVDDDKIAYHAWVSEWKGKNDLNKYSIWIEIHSDWKIFTNEQREATGELVKKLMLNYNIEKENILRHKDISPNRKWDVWDNFWNNLFDTYEEYINATYWTRNKYNGILDKLIDEGYNPIFSKHEWDKPLNEAEVKTLIDIATCRLWKRLLK